MSLPHRALRGLLALALFAAGSGCDGGASPDEVVDAGALTPLVLEEELRIGSVDDPDAGFSEIRGVAVAPDGLVYVLERQERQIRVYDRAGTLVRVIGRPGEGPGEFRQPSSFGLIGDTLWVNDITLQRITLFRRSGELVTTFKVPRITIEPMPGIMVMLQAGSLRSDRFLASTWMIPIPRDPPADSFWIPQVRMDTTGAIVDTIRLMRWAFTPRATVSVGGQELPGLPAPLSSPLELTIGDDRVVVERPVAAGEDAAMFVVTRITTGGDTLFRRSFRYRPRPFPTEYADSLVARRAASYTRLGIDVDAAAAALRASLALPAFQPPVSTGRVHEDSTLWLQREEDAGGATRRWLLIAPDGEPRGSLELPRGVTIHWSAGDVAWAAVRDEQDVPWLVRYRIRSADSGSQP